MSLYKRRRTLNVHLREKSSDGRLSSVVIREFEAYPSPADTLFTGGDDEDEEDTSEDLEEKSDSPFGIASFHTRTLGSVGDGDVEEKVKDGCEADAAEGDPWRVNGPVAVRL